MAGGAGRRYTTGVQLRTARLCLDCEELHEAQQCPVCASETFAYIMRWVPVPSRSEPHPARQTQPPDEVAQYRRLLTADATRPKAMRLLKRGAVGLAVVSLARWAWVRRRREQEKASARARPTPPPPETEST